jgi:hypothetical protein
MEIFPVTSLKKGNCFRECARDAVAPSFLSFGGIKQLLMISYFFPRQICEIKLLIVGNDQVVSCAEFLICKKLSTLPGFLFVAKNLIPLWAGIFHIIS